MKKRLALLLMMAVVLTAAAVPGTLSAEAASAGKKSTSETVTEEKTAGEEETGAAEEETAEKKKKADQEEIEDGFQTIDGKTYYYKDGKRLKKQWLTLDGKTYYFGKSGVMVSGKVKTKKVMYYFDENGVFLRKIKRNKKMIALTYDDGPSAYTPMIIKELKKVGGRATFFVVGNRVNIYKKQLKEAFDADCEIGNHSWDHANLNKLGASGIRNQIRKTNQAVKKVTGTVPVILRPPYGANNSTVRRAAGMPLITWNVDTLDWKTRSTAKTTAHVKSHAADGSIILMHDLHKPTAQAAKYIIPWLAKKGYQLVTVSEMADCRGGMKAGVTYSSFRKK